MFNCLVPFDLSVIENISLGARKVSQHQDAVPVVDVEWRNDLSRASDRRLAVHPIRKHLCLGHGK